MTLATGAIILSAGCSARLGRNKQLVRLAGQSLVRRAARLMQEAEIRAVTVVTGFESDLVRPELDGVPCVLVENPNWQAGMGSSISAGVRAALALHPGLDSLLIVLPDQILVDAQHIRALMDTGALSPRSIVATRYADTLGAPVIFKKSRFIELRQLSPSAGAKHLLKADLVEAVDCPAAALDLDTPLDLEKAVALFGSAQP